MVSEGGCSAGANLYTAFRRPPLVAGATTFLPAKAVGLWALGSGVHLRVEQ